MNRTNRALCCPNLRGHIPTVSVRDLSGQPRTAPKNESKTAGQRPTTCPSTHFDPFGQVAGSCPSGPPPYKGGPWTDDGRTTQKRPAKTPPRRATDRVDHHAHADSCRTQLHGGNQ